MPGRERLGHHPAVRPADEDVRRLLARGRQGLDERVGSTAGPRVRVVGRERWAGADAGAVVGAQPGPVLEPEGERGERVAAGVEARREHHRRSALAAAVDRQRVRRRFASASGRSPSAPTSPRPRRCHRRTRPAGGSPRPGMRCGVAATPWQQCGRARSRMRVDGISGRRVDRHAQHRLDRDPRAADPGLDPGEAGRAELLDPADPVLGGRACRDLEVGHVGQVEVQVELGLRCAAGEVAEGFGLADARAGRRRRRS